MCIKTNTITLLSAGKPSFSTVIKILLFILIGKVHAFQSEAETWTEEWGGWNPEKNNIFYGKYGFLEKSGLFKRKIAFSKEKCIFRKKNSFFKRKNVFLERKIAFFKEKIGFFKRKLHFWGNKMGIYDSDLKSRGGFNLLKPPLNISGGVSTPSTPPRFPPLMILLLCLYENFYVFLVTHSQIYWTIYIYKFGAVKNIVWPQKFVFFIFKAIITFINCCWAIKSIGWIVNIHLKYVNFMQIYLRF